MYQPNQYDGYSNSWLPMGFRYPSPRPPPPPPPPMSYMSPPPPSLARPPPPPPPPPPPEDNIIHKVVPNHQTGQTDLHASSVGSESTEFNSNQRCSGQNINTLPNINQNSNLNKVCVSNNSFSKKNSSKSAAVISSHPIDKSCEELSSDNNDPTSNTLQYKSPLENARDNVQTAHYPPRPAKTSTKRKRLVVDLDPSYPPELVAKIQNNECSLCGIKLNSAIQAKNHYEGKPHAKKVRRFLSEHGAVAGTDTSSASSEGESPTKVTKLNNAESPKKSESLENVPSKKKNKVDIEKLFCQACNLSLTSEAHAKQHYLGRNHDRVLHGLKPLRDGPLDARVTSALLGSELPDSEDGKQRPEVEKVRGRFICTLCNVAATSQEQLDGHYKGSRHKKALRQEANKNNVESVTTSISSTDSILASVMKTEEAKKSKGKDYSMYRTPSGKFYCSPCDITLNSESQFAQHVDSKKHKAKKLK